MNPLFANQGISIFEHMSGLAREHEAVNLGQGFPDFGWPEDVIDAAAKALVFESNQYPPMRGTAELRRAICDHYRQHHGLDLDVDQVTVTSGATEALAAAIMAVVSPGDEVLMFQPLYDSYLPIVRRCGGVPQLARLDPPDWRITAEMLADAVSDRTRLIIFNNPLNPAARVFSEEELGLLAEACTRHDVLVLSDEVWEHVVFDGRRHVALGGIAGMAERTIKVGSGGKIFSMTGWKVGWMIAGNAAAHPIANAHQFLTFTTPPNLQAGVAYGLAKERDYFEAMRARFAASRDVLARGLETAGFATLPAEGTYFLCVDLAASGVSADDLTFCERAVREAGVAAIPVSAFYDDPDPVRHIIRLCFAKRPETIEAGIERLAVARRLFAN